MTRDFVSVCTRSGVCLAHFRRGKPVQVLRYTFDREQRVDTAMAYLLEWTGWTGLWDAPAVVMEHTDRTRYLSDQTLRDTLPRAIRPDVPLHSVRVGEWKREAGGAFVTKHEVLAAARRRWPQLEIPDVESAIACFVGAAFVQRSGLSDQ